MNRTGTFCTAWIPPDLNERARRAAARELTTRSEIVRKALEFYLSSIENTTPQREARNEHEPIVNY